MQLTYRNRPKVNRCLSGVKPPSLVALIFMRFKRRKFGYMLEYLSIRPYFLLEVTIGSVQTISREDPLYAETLRDYTPKSLY